MKHYKKGNVIIDLNDLLSEDVVFYNNGVYSLDWIYSFELGVIMNGLKLGYFRYAIVPLDLKTLEYISQTDDQNIKLFEGKYLKDLRRATDGSIGCTVRMERW